MVDVAHGHAIYHVWRLAIGAGAEASACDGGLWELVREVDEVHLVLVAGGEVARGQAA